jgi:predicted TIM-barrel fold metal-dependent hydrolase
MKNPTQRQDQTGLHRRDFIAASLSLFGAAAWPRALHAADTAPEPVIDIHQHHRYRDRPDDNLLFHQKTIGVTTTVLLPGGEDTGNPPTTMSLNAAVLEFARAHPKQFYFFANARADQLDARQEVEKYLKFGAIGIGEQKSKVPCDSRHMEILAELAGEFDVPMLMHFEHGMYNTGLERFHKMLQKFPRVKFIGHAQEWWGHIDRNHDPKSNYPKGKVTAGGLTDRLLADYPNLWGDLAANSGSNALMRDEEHAREFLARHQDKLMFGSDCTDQTGRGPICIGARQIATIRRLAPTKSIERKLLYENARKLLRIT